ncbi:hypothetical protein HYZ78_04150 [Candidatus Microgenomates bacterium]|nr:hypothetical protein [Candidatus Microgenomates bacterium]
MTKTKSSASCAVELSTLTKLSGQANSSPPNRLTYQGLAAHFGTTARTEQPPPRKKGDSATRQRRGSPKAATRKTRLKVMDQEEFLDFTTIAVVTFIYFSPSPQARFFRQFTQFTIS